MSDSRVFAFWYEFTYKWEKQRECLKYGRVESHVERKNGSFKWNDIMTTHLNMLNSTSMHFIAVALVRPMLTCEFDISSLRLVLDQKESSKHTKYRGMHPVSGEETDSYKLLFVFLITIICHGRHTKTTNFTNARIWNVSMRSVTITMANNIRVASRSMEYFPSKIYVHLFVRYTYGCFSKWD